MLKVSIIVPVYNVEKYIDKCLFSLVNQTLEEIEIIVVNDGSKDKSEEIIEKYIKQYPTKIKYFEKKNGGLSSARNYGIEYATGEYVAFLDSDDYVEKNMYEEMYKIAKIENSDMVECDFIWEWNYGRRVFDKNKNAKLNIELKNDKYKKEIMKRPRVVAWNKIYKREIINSNKIKYPEGLIYEDIEFYYKIMPYLNRISYLNKFLVHYVQRNDSISNLKNGDTGDIFYILDNIYNYYKENELLDKYEKELKYAIKRILLGSSLKRILRIEKTQIKRKMIVKTVTYLIKYSFRKNNKKNRTILKDNKNKVCFGITELGIGGAERVLVDIVNEMCNDYEITIFCIFGKGELESELNSKIHTVSIFKNNIKNTIIPIFVLICGKFIYTKFLKGKFDIEVAFLEGPITRIFAYGRNVKKIAWVHNDIIEVFGKGKKAEIKRYLDKWFYRRYDKIIFVSEQNKKIFEKIYGNISDRKVIYNYINKQRVLKLAKENIEEEEKGYIIKNQNEKNIIVVSRLVKQKAIDRLIRVHKKIIDEGINHKIFVIGDGDERNSLEELTKTLQINKSFIFLGKKNNPYPFIKKADFFALLSYFEGYGMVLEEAKILNKTILVTKTAAVEAVKNYDDKIIIENNEEDIYKALKKILLGEYFFSKQKNNAYNYENLYLIEQIKNLLI